MRRKYALSESERSHVRSHTGRGTAGDRRPDRNLGAAYPACLLSLAFPYKHPGHQDKRSPFQRIYSFNILPLSTQLLSP